MDDSEILITGANGQLGRALKALYPGSRATDSSELDITDKSAVDSYDWSGVKVIVNAAAYTNVDGAETPEGGQLAWAVNDKAVGYLADIANKNDALLVHISTAYVFDGDKKTYTEQDMPNPLGVYAKSKAAGDEKAAKANAHYIVRTDSVVGDGKNFVRTMLGLAKQAIAPKVVADQIIRPTFASELARAIKFLIEHKPEFGIYNLTNEGDPISWADFTREIFKSAGTDLQVSDTTLREYAAGKPGVAPRPMHSVLDLGKIETAGFTPHNWRDDLKMYVKEEMSK